MDALVKKAMQGDNDAFAELFRKHKVTLYRIGKSYLDNDEDIADAMQNTILTAYEKLNTLKHPEYFSTWLIRIMINQCKHTRKNMKYFDSLENLEVRSDSEPVENTVYFRDMVDSLSPPYRIVLNLYYGENFSIKEIAEILELSESAVKKRLSRGRELLKTRYFSQENSSEVNA